jgi:hypothetical protein
MNADMYRGRGWARVGFWVGVGASVAANIAHAFIADSPSWLLLLFAALPPFALLVGIEVIAQVRWRPVWYQYVIRWGAVGSVAGIGGVVSYDQMREALHAHGASGVGSILLPLMIDGLMTVCSAALLTIGDNVRRAERAELPLVLPAEVVPAEPVAKTPQVPAVVEPKPAAVKPARAPRKAAAAPVAKPAKTTPRRPAQVTKALAAQALASTPDVTRAAVAEALDITPRRLRQVLNENSGEQQTVNGQMPGQLALVPLP